MKFCKKCGTETERYASGGCKPCARERRHKQHAANPERSREQVRKWRATNPERSHEQGRRWRAANPERSRELARKWSAANPEKKREINRRCWGLPEPTRPEPETCELCGGFSKQAVHLDHNHATDKFRGWLCGNCNVGLGNFYDDPTRLRQAIDYLERSK